MSDTGLTRRQQQILDVIRRESARRGYPPSVREIGEALGLRSPSTVHGHLVRLARKGYIRRDPSKRRAIELLWPPAGADDTGRGPALRDGAGAADAAAVPDLPDGEHPSSVSRRLQWVPLVGRVTAGQPILAVENVEGWMPLPHELVQDGEEVFALRVRGDSMVGAGIADGDIVFVRRQPSADNGAIVVALIGDEATVKRFFREPEGIRLQPANDAYPPVITRRAVILGKVIGLFRRLT